MFTLLKAIIGGAAYKAKREATGVTYLRDTLRRAGADPNRMPQEFYQELSAYAYDFAQNMAKLSSRDKPVTYFVEHLEYIVGAIQDAFEDKSVNVPEPVKDIFVRHGLKAHRS